MTDYGGWTLSTRLGRSLWWTGVGLGSSGGASYVNNSWLTDRDLPRYPLSHRIPTLSPRVQVVRPKAEVKSVNGTETRLVNRGTSESKKQTFTLLTLLGEVFLHTLKLSHTRYEFYPTKCANPLLITLQKSRRKRMIMTMMMTTTTMKIPGSGSPRFLPLS